MIILGMSEGFHDAGLCLLENDKIVFASLNWNIWCVTKQTFPEVKCNYIMLYIVNRLLNVAADNNHFFYL